MFWKTSGGLALSSGVTIAAYSVAPVSFASNLQYLKMIKDLPEVKELVNLLLAALASYINAKKSMLINW